MITLVNKKTLTPLQEPGFNISWRRPTLPHLMQYHRRCRAYPPAGGSEWEEGAPDAKTT